jgi:hypothetical protein
MARSRRQHARDLSLPRYTRRSFLALGGAALGGAVVLSACGGDDDNGSPASSDDYTELAPGVLSGDLYKSTSPQRFAFAMTAKEGYASGMEVRIAVAPPGETPTDFQPTTLHNEGLPPQRGVYVMEVELPVAGAWNAYADAQGERVPFAFHVYDEPHAPVAGVDAPRAASPTPQATLGVDPICTADPMCPLHSRSLDTLIGKGRPVAVMFATPARCASQYCAPVLDELLAVSGDYEEQVDFVHVDIYKNNRTNDTSPTVQAWNLPSEPFLFTVDAAGKVVARLDGGFDRNEIRTLLDELVA